ncbi:MAG: omptin family outer membrane protease [Spirochaetota bacterium]|jgi:outer membrane protease|nr:omptin family outer membrane protease [Spirochaetota bacterium]
MRFRPSLFGVFTACLVFCGSGTLNALPSPGFFWSEDRASLQFGGSFAYGQVKEYVFSGNYLLSRLDWDAHNLFGARFGGAYKFESCIISAAFLLGIPGGCGILKDYDWAETDAAGNYLYNGVPSHYSEHRNILKNSFRFDCDFLLPWVNGRRWRFDWIYGLTWQHYSFAGKDGFYQYPPTSAPITIEGPVATYTTDAILPVMGLAYSRDMNNGFAFTSMVKLGIAGFQRGYDEHHLRKLDFIDYFIFLPYIELRQQFSLSLAERFDIEIAIFLLCYPRAPGLSYLKDLDTGNIFRLASRGGARAESIGAEINFHFMFEKKESPETANDAYPLIEETEHFAPRE